MTAARSEAERLRGVPALPAAAKVTEYRLCPVPITDDLPDGYLWDVTVRRCFSMDDGAWTDQWQVKAVAFTLSPEGQWWPERNVWPDCRFPDLPSAMAAADAGQWTLRINGKTARDVLAERGEGQ